MLVILHLLGATVVNLFRSRRRLEVENLFLRHQLNIALRVVVPTVGFDLLYAIVIVRLVRRDLVWINVTANPTAECIAPTQQR
jgi:hypothetical protein